MTVESPPAPSPTPPPLWSTGVVPHQATWWQGILARLIYAVARLVSATIRSLSGNSCKLRYGDKTAETPTKAGNMYTFDGARIVNP